MNAIANKTREYVSSIVRQWSNVSALTVLNFGEDRYDPNWVVSFDVYYRDSIPAPEERQQAFSDGQAYETTFDGDKDRFLVDDVPVRLEFKSVEKIEKDLTCAGNVEDVERHNTTYGFHRLVYGETVLERDDWLKRARQRLGELPNEYWERRITRQKARVEHYLGDLTAALYGNDEYFYLLSLGRFLASVAAVMFAVNRRFDPSPRSTYREILGLPILPTEFSARMETIVRDDSAISRARKRELAQLLVRSIVAL